MAIQKCLVSAIIAVLLMQAGPATWATELVYESFDYAVGSGLNGQNGGTGWGGAWTAVAGGSGTLDLVAQDIVAPAGFPASVGNQLLITPNGTTQNMQRNLATAIDLNPATQQVYYFSHLLRRDDPVNSGTENTSFRLINSSNAVVAQWGWGSNEVVGTIMGAPPAEFGTNTLTIGEDYLFVAKLVANPAGTDDLLYASLIPTSAAITSTEPVTWDIFSPEDVTDTITAFKITEPQGANLLSFDEFRMGTTYADVVPVPALHAGDANGDGMVNLADLQILGDNWQSTTATWSEADFTGDGNVNLADLQILGDNWGFGVSPDVAFDEALAQVAIPEPGVCGLLAVGGLLAMLRRRG